MKTRGILVVGTGAVEKIAGKPDPAENILHSGDYIVADQRLRGDRERKGAVVSRVGASFRAYGPEGRARMGKSHRLLWFSLSLTKKEVKLSLWVRDDTETSEH